MVVIASICKDCNLLHYNDGVVWVEMQQNWGLSEGEFELLEGCLVLWSPDKFDVLSSEAGEMDCCVREVDNEMMIEVGITEK